MKWSVFHRVDKRIFAGILGIAACTAAVVIGISTYRQADIAGKEAPAPAPVYEFKEYRGRVAVFRYHDTIPLEILDVRIDSLPEFDQRELRRGVYVYSEKELQNRIEDYDS